MTRAVARSTAGLEGNVVAARRETAVHASGDWTGEGSFEDVEALATTAFATVAVAVVAGAGELGST